MDDMLKDFCAESKGLIDQMAEILEKVEADPTQFKVLEEFGQVVDRIMGSAKFLALNYPPDHPIHGMANFAELCKIIGYKASQTNNNSNLITVVVAFLFDATEALATMTYVIDTDQTKMLNEVLTSTFLDRLHWLASKFDENLRATVAITKESANSTQADIDALLKQMGVKR